MFQFDNEHKVSLSSTPGEAGITINYLAIKKAAAILRALNHKLRKQIVKLVFENEGITVTEIFSQLYLDQSLASQHLAILRRAGILKTTRKGKYIHYSVNKKRLEEINQFVASLVG